MSNDIPQDIALRWQVAMFVGDEPRTSCLEVRALSKRGSVVHRRFVRVYGLGTLMREVERLSFTANVLVSCAPRISYTSGTREDIERVWCLWADCDSSESVERLPALPQPSLVAESGGPGRLHVYWQLTSPLSTDYAKRANRRIAKALGSDAAAMRLAVRVRSEAPITSMAGSSRACNWGRSATGSRTSSGDFRMMSAIGHDRRSNGSSGDVQATPAA